MEHNQWGRKYSAALFSPGHPLEPDDRHMNAAWGSGFMPICHPCRPDIQSLKPLLYIDLSPLGREGSKFWKLYRKYKMEEINHQAGTKNKSLQKLPPSLPIWVGSDTGAFFVLNHVAHFSPANPPVISETFNANPR